MFGKLDQIVKPIGKSIFVVCLSIVALYFLNHYLGKREPTEKAKMQTVTSDDSLKQAALAYEQGKRVKLEKGEKEKQAEKEKKGKNKESADSKKADDSAMAKIIGKIWWLPVTLWLITLGLMLCYFGWVIKRRHYIRVPTKDNQSDENQGRWKRFKKRFLPQFPGGDLTGGEIIAIASFFVTYIVGFLIAVLLGGIEAIKYPLFINLVMWGITVYAIYLLLRSSYLEVPMHSRWLLEVQGEFEAILFPGPHFFLRIAYNVTTVDTSPSEDPDSHGTMEIVKQKVRRQFWFVPDLNCVSLREITFDMEHDEVTTVDGLRPTVDIVLSFFVPDIDPQYPIKGLGARNQAVWKFVYEFVRLNRRDELIQGLQSESDTAIRQYASQVPFIRQVGDIIFDYPLPDGMKPLNEAQPELEKAIRERIVRGDSLTEAICVKGGLSVRSVQVKRIVPPKDFEATMRKLQETQIDAATAVKRAEGEKAVAIKKAEGERDKRTLEADGDKKAELAHAEGMGEGIAILSERSGLSARAAADYRLTREGQNAFVEAAKGSKSTVLSVPSSVDGLATLIAAGKTVFLPDDTVNKSAGSDKGDNEIGKPAAKESAGSKAPASGNEKKTKEGGEKK